MKRHELLGRLQWQAGQTVLAPERGVSGSWIGAPSAAVHDGSIYLAYRLRDPERRGFANVIARSADGVTLETVAVIERDRHRAESLERPCLIRTADSWRLYISCATAGSKHWRVDMLEAETIAGLPQAPPTTVLPGDGSTGVKDPVILRAEDGWHLWAAGHPLDDPAATDRMTTGYFTSSDGLRWIRQGVALRGRTGEWDARGVRFAEVLWVADGFLALYDGRAGAGQNWEERTGAAVADSLDGQWQPVPGPVFVSPFGTGGLRYLCAVVDPAGGRRVYYESALGDGSHELRTQLLEPGDVRQDGQPAGQP